MQHAIEQNVRRKWHHSKLVTSQCTTAEEQDREKESKIFIIISKTLIYSKFHCDILAERQENFHTIIKTIHSNKSEKKKVVFMAFVI